MDDSSGKLENKRQIFLDTETTGLEVREGNRIIEIGCVEMIGRKLTHNNYHQYIKPDRESEEGALKVHGITTEFLSDKPRFEDIYTAFIEYVKGAELIIHNAPFDVAFLDHEFSRITGKNVSLEDYCEITDSLVLARDLHPGQRNSLDALCKRYFIVNEHRQLHGALLDSEILADVYLAMTGGQKTLLLGEDDGGNGNSQAMHSFRRLDTSHTLLPVIKAGKAELSVHQEYLDQVETDSGKKLWLN